MPKGQHATPRVRRAHRQHRKWPWFVAGVIVLLGLTAGGTAYAAYRYDRSHLGMIMPGVRIAGLDVSGLTKEEALAKVQSSLDAQISRPTVVQAVGKTWEISPKEMGAKAPAAAAVDEAVSIGERYEWTERFWRRFNSHSENQDYEIPVSVDPELIRAFVAKVSGAVGENPVSGGLRLSGNDLQFVRSQPGRELVAAKALGKVREALRNAIPTVKLPVAKVKPKDTGTNSQVIVVDLSENRLFLYEGKKIDRKFTVATGAPGFPTPTGSFSIIGKRKNPTWTNPSPNGWGSSMPPSIPPGPGNPLGTRALDLNAPGIRIHGTSDIGSLGTAASHGCIRMAMPDVEQLYDLVDIGTAVLIKK